MKGTFFAAVAAMASLGAAHNHRQVHQLIKKDGLAATGVAAPTGEMCVPGCTTVWKTITGEMTLVPTSTVTSTRYSTSTETCTVPATTLSSSTPVLPTPHPVTCPTPGTYTIPAKTITVNQTTTVCGATSTKVPPGTHTVGGHTTIVKTSTIVTCPVATVTTHHNKTTSTVIMTTYVCPSAGTYTVGAHTTTVSKETVIVYPTPTSYLPGTYTAPHTTVTITETGTVYYCPFTSSGIPAPTPQPQQPAPKPQPKPEPKPEQPKPEQPKPEQPKPQQPKPQTPLGDMTGPSDMWAITYTPYRSSDGTCKSASEVEKDISELKSHGFTTVRIYSSDCNTYQTVAPACEKFGMTMIIGVFVKNTGCSINTPDIKKQVDDIVAWSKWTMVKLFVVGNEGVQSGSCSVQQLQQLIVDVKSRCSGYTGHWTTAETINVWQQPEVQSALCPHVSVTGANIHAYFNPNTPSSDAGKFTQGQLDILKNICKGNQVINLEGGWPSGGNANGKAVASPQDQATAISSIRKTCGNQVVFFSFEDDSWKQPGYCACEQKWGIKNALSI
ncbi:hypothetical protein VHEMI01805 [[Torrubiella] hemipterigena]|uniref:Probable beta-glucosidase btgE n=1 Tax=[Torrubiella] hemipterigena TaxID=1531966 RepID=A0A0A1T8M5_9HYPO|nr:hypothetical protein VHEMI01805 [[Torrubiella] hemipterigena]